LTLEIVKINVSNRPIKSVSGIVDEQVDAFKVVCGEFNKVVNF